RQAFREKMDDDFSAPAALAVLQEFTRQVNTLLNEGPPQSEGTLQAIVDLYDELGGRVLGLIPSQAEAGRDAGREQGLIALLVELRAAARARRDWAASDQIRNRLKELGVTLEDRADGTAWKLG
ncbi:MAG: DALR domain-containing protein, partial [Candidatus Promineifilaceae bacterium]